MAIAILGTCIVTPPAWAQQFMTSIVDVRQGSELSALASGLGEGGYDLQDGTWVSFDKWYHTDWPEVHVDFLTQFSSYSGLLWGFSTGERGEKYEIQPGLKLGLITQTQLTPTSTLTFSMATTIWGSFSELPCEADYGEFFGSYTVNCRLAATDMAPEDTLRYMINEEPSRLNLSLSFRGNF